MNHEHWQNWQERGRRSYFGEEHWQLSGERDFVNRDYGRTFDQRFDDHWSQNFRERHFTEPTSLYSDQRHFDISAYNRLNYEERGSGMQHHNFCRSESPRDHRREQAYERQNYREQRSEVDDHYFSRSDFPTNYYNERFYSADSERRRFLDRSEEYADNRYSRSDNYKNTDYYDDDDNRSRERCMDYVDRCRSSPYRRDKGSQSSKERRNSPLTPSRKAERKKGLKVVVSDDLKSVKNNHSPIITVLSGDIIANKDSPVFDKSKVSSKSKQKDDTNSSKNRNLHEKHKASCTKVSDAATDKTMGKASDSRQNKSRSAVSEMSLKSTQKKAVNLKQSTSCTAVSEVKTKSFVQNQQSKNESKTKTTDVPMVSHLDSLKKCNSDKSKEPEKSQTDQMDTSDRICLKQVENVNISSTPEKDQNMTTPTQHFTKVENGNLQKLSVLSLNPCLSQDVHSDHQPAENSTPAKIIPNPEKTTQCSTKSEAVIVVTDDEESTRIKRTEISMSPIQETECSVKNHGSSTQIENSSNRILNVTTNLTAERSFPIQNSGNSTGSFSEKTDNSTVSRVENNFSGRDSEKNSSTGPNFLGNFQSAQRQKDSVSEKKGTDPCIKKQLLKEDVQKCKKAGLTDALCIKKSSESSVTRNDTKHVINDVEMTNLENKSIDSCLKKPERSLSESLQSSDGKFSVDAGKQTPSESRQSLSTELSGEISQKRYGTPNREKKLCSDDSKLKSRESNKGKEKRGEERLHHRHHGQDKDSSSPSQQTKKLISQRGRHDFHRSYSEPDHKPEITPQTAKSFPEYKKALQLQREREEREKERKRELLRQSSSERRSRHSSRPDKRKDLPSRHNYVRVSEESSTTRDKPSTSDMQDAQLPELSKRQELSKADISKFGQERQMEDIVAFDMFYSAADDDDQTENPGGGLSDLDIDLEDSSDDDLLEAPSFLQDLERAVSQPVPGTPPPKIYSSWLTGGSPEPMTSLLNCPSTTSRFAKFSLDSLLAEETDKPEDQRDLEKIHAELKESVSHGGFIKDTLEKEEEPKVKELLPEHQVQLRHFEVQKSVISSVHPGETIFCPSQYKQLFTSSLSPPECGFMPGSAYIDKYLARALPRDFPNIITSDVLIHCLEKVSCPKKVLRWLMFLMSIESNHLVKDGCYRVIEEYLYCQKAFKDNQDPWAPAVEDVLSIVMNCGASKDSVLPPELFRDEASLRFKVTRQEGQHLPPPNAGSFNRENLRVVFQALALALQARPKYTSSHLTALYIILCKVAIDKSLNIGLLNVEIQSCLRSILACYPESSWKKHVLVLCSMVPTLTHHHHNKAYLASLSPHGARGQFLQRRVSVLMLHQLFNCDQFSGEEIENCQIKHLHRFLPMLQELVNTDMYKLSSCMSLIDLSVGNGSIKVSEKESLQFLSEQIKKISGDTRDDVRMLDRSRVKDLMVRLTSKWTLLLLNVGSKQKSIFAYTTSTPQNIKIETVQTSQVDQQDSESSEEEEACPADTRDESPVDTKEASAVDTKDSDPVDARENSSVIVKVASLVKDKETNAEDVKEYS